MTSPWKGQCRRHRGVAVVTGVVVWLAVWSSAGLVAAQTAVVEADDIEELCELGAPVADESDDDAEYHRNRRQAVHRLYETPLSEIDAGLVRYDRVASLLTISGFRTYQPDGGGPAIQFRNECLLKFEVDEQQAHDLRAQLQMGTVELIIGYSPVARRDYDRDFCPEADDGSRRLIVDLLYARLVDTERDESTGGRILGSYYTPQGHRWVLRHREALVGGPDAVPDVEISDIQWRPRGGDWGDDFGDDAPGRDLDEKAGRLASSVEQSLYPCYLSATADKPSLQGALVVEVPVGDEGGGEPSFLLDTLAEDDIRRCVRERIRQLEVVDPEVVADTVDAWKATVLMRRR